MTLYRVTYRGNNSGGYVWTSEADGDALREAGWLVDESGNPYGGAAFMSESDNEEEALYDAMSSWYTATKLDPDAEGCNCCGTPHHFEADAEGEWVRGWQRYPDDPFDYRDGVE